MKHIILTVVIVLVSSPLFSQDKGEILVSYDVTRLAFPRDSAQYSNMLLIFNKDKSKYYNELSQWSDSLSSTPEGKRELQEIIWARCVIQGPDGSITFNKSNGPVKDIFTYVFNDLNKEELTHYDKWGTEQGYYTEPLNEINWEIGDSTQNILGYECIMAETDYHGRHWKAWFTPEIPVPFGPWKLRGLPGLILYAVSDNGAKLKASGLQTSDKDIIPIYSPENYIKVNRKKALSDDEYYHNNTESIIKAQYGGEVYFGSDFTKRPKFEKEKHTWESDY